VSVNLNWDEVRRLLDDLYRAADRLEELFPGRKFTLDGHLVGSLGEVIAAYMFDLKLLPGSNKAHDAVAVDGRKVEVKLTQGSSVAIRHEPEHLIVLRRQKGQSIEIVFNGPGSIAWENAGCIGKNGQRPIGLNKLAHLNKQVAAMDQLQIKNPSPF
jgi:hypothetical protein